MLIFTTWFGSFLLDGETVVEVHLFPKDPADIAHRLAIVEDWGVLEEEKKILSTHRNLQTVEPRLEKKAGCEMIPRGAEKLDCEDYGFSRDILRDAMLKVVEKKFSEPPGPDQLIIHAVRAVDDLTQTSNLLIERLAEWYGHHYPELRPMVQDQEFAKLVSAFGTRQAIWEARPDLATKSLGAEMEPDDMESVRLLAGTAASLFASRDEAESYVVSMMEQVMPNTTRVVGPILGAKLLAQAGNLKKLAMLPSSTVQVLGAEKALFRHIRDGTEPPKHGLLFQHPLVHRAPYWQRGRIARAIAGKVSLAARLDWREAPEGGEMLKETLDARIDEIRKKHPEPPKKRADGKTPGRPGPRGQQGRDSRERGSGQGRRGGARPPGRGKPRDGSHGYRGKGRGDNPNKSYGRRD